MTPTTRIPGLKASSAKTNKLYQNRPNPFNESTTIEHKVNPASQQAKLYVHSINGSQILEKDLEVEGTEVILSANILESGLYIYSLLAAGNARM